MQKIDTLSRRSLLIGIGAATLPIGSDRAWALSGNAVVDRARNALGKRTKYLNEAKPPLPSTDDWPIGIEADCSGFVAWCFRLDRNQPRVHDHQLYTDTMFDDARGRHLFFRAVTEPAPGDIVLYPYYRNTDRKRLHPGHVAIITAVRGRADYDIIDCSETMGKAGDAITQRQGEVFENHRKLLGELRQTHREWNVGSVGAPIFARGIA